MLSGIIQIMYFMEMIIFFHLFHIILRIDYIFINLTSLILVGFSYVHFDTRLIPSHELARQTIQEL